MTPKEKLSAAILGVRIKISLFLYYLGFKKRIMGGIFGFLILTGALGVGVYLVQTRQNTSIQASGPVLSLSSTSTKPKVGDSFTVAASLDTKGEGVSAADLRIRYETSKLEVISIKPVGNFLTNVLTPGRVDLTDTPLGRVAIVVGISVNQSRATPKVGFGVLAQITFKAKAAGSTEIFFGPGSAVTVVGKTGDAATKNSVRVDLQSQGGAATPTPLSTPKPSSTPTPTQRPSNTPEPTSTPTTKPCTGGKARNCD